VEWAIGGVKSKWRRLMKCLDSTKEKKSIFIDKLLTYASPRIHI
jgi:hypothetical protein